MKGLIRCFVTRASVGGDEAADVALGIVVLAQRGGDRGMCGKPWPWPGSGS